jgi:uncharacterized membrane protein
VVALYTLMLGGAIGLAVEFWFHGRPIWLAPGAVAMSLAFVLWIMLARWAMPVVQGNVFDDPLTDERQKQVLDRAYRQAYHVISVLAALSLLIFFLFWAWVDGDHFKELVTPRHVMALVFLYATGVIALIPSLPSACLAWSEPDDVS